MNEYPAVDAETKGWCYCRRIDNPVRLVRYTPWGSGPDGEGTTWTLYRSNDHSIFGETVGEFKTLVAAHVYAANNYLTIVAEVHMNESWVARFDTGSETT